MTANLHGRRQRSTNIAAAVYRVSVGRVQLQTPPIQHPLRRGNPQALRATYNQRGTMDTRDQHMQYISQSIREVPDWPKKGILFQDITSMLLDAKVKSY